MIKMVTTKRWRKRRAEPETKSAVPATDFLENFSDVLNRDQRTILTINRFEGRNSGYSGRNREDGASGGVVGGGGDELFFRSQNFPLKNFNKTFKFFENWPKTRSQSWRSRRKFNLSRLGEVFIVGVCLLTLVRVPAVMAAPSGCARLLDGTPNYLCICGVSNEANLNTSLLPETDSNILNRLITLTKDTLSYTESFKHKFVQKTFNLPFETHHAKWINHSYNWLPNDCNDIPKRLGKNVDRQHLESKKFDKFLVNIYEYFQKFAIALEQVVRDQFQTNGGFHSNFQKTKLDLRHVLCEVRTAMAEKHIIPKDHVLPSIMEKDVRELEGSERNLRDWLIFRDLMNSLEYAVEVFNFFEEELSRASTSTSSS